MGLTEETFEGNGPAVSEFIAAHRADPKNKAMWAAYDVLWADASPEEIAAIMYGDPDYHGQPLGVLVARSPGTNQRPLTTTRRPPLGPR